MKRKILILGGGFGGIKTALELCDDDRFDITLVSDQSDFRYYPALYRTATGGSKAQSRIPLADIFEGKNITIEKDEVTKLDRQKQLIHGKTGKTYGYDSLVIALGVVTNYFGIKGLKQYSFGIKSVEEAAELKSHIHKQLLEDGRPDLNYIVIGGGPTGVELSGALPSYIKRAMKNHGLNHRSVRVDLVEAESRVLPRMPKDVSRAVAKRLRKLGVKLYLGKKVEGQTSDSLMVNGKPIETETVAWTAGVTNHPFLRTNSFNLTPNGKAVVNQFLEAEPNIFVIGDNANTPYSGLAQTALWDGKYVAKHIKQQLDNTHPDPYVPRKPIYVVPAGPKWAAVVWGRVRIYGRVGWWLRRAADLIGYHDLEPWWKASQQWLEENVKEEECSQCLTK